MSDFTSHESIVQDIRALPVMLTGKLIGREAALAQVYAGMKAGKPVQVYGPSGVGKTALAATLAAAYLQQTGHVLWMTVEHPKLEELLVRVGRAYAIDEVTNNPNPASMIGAIENTLKSKKPLVVLDGDIQPGIAAQFISRCAEGVPVIIATEQKLEGVWASLELEPLEAEDGAALFKREARIATHDHDIDAFGIAKSVGYLPAGIVVAARAMLASKQTPDAYIKLMQQIANAAGGNSPVVALTASFRALTGPLQGLLLMMGASFNGKASPELLSMVSGAPVESVQQAMNILAQLHLIERVIRYETPYYQMHPIAHDFTQTWLKNSNRLGGLQEKVRDTILAYAKKHGTGSPDAYSKMAVEMDSFLAAAKWADELGDDSVATDIVAALAAAGDFVKVSGYLYEQMQLTALSTGTPVTFPAHEEASLLPPEDMPPEELLMSDGGDGDGDFFDNFTDDSAVIADLLAEDDEEDDNDDFLDNSTDDSAVVADLLAEDDEESFEDLLAEDEFDDYEEDDDDFLDDDDDDSMDFALAGDLMDEDSAAVNVPVSATADLTTRDLAKLRTALAEAKQAGDSAQQIEALQAISDAQIEGNMANEAIATHTELLSIYEMLDDRTGILDTLDMLASLMVKTDNSQAAIMHGTRGVTLADELYDSETKMHILIVLGDARQQLGEGDLSARDYGNALEIARDQGDKQNEAIILYKLGFAQLDDNDAEIAVDTWEQALALFKTQNKRDYEGRALGGLGSAYADMDRWAEAVNFHTSALYIARETQNKDEEALQLGNLAYAALQADKLGEAVLRYRQALHLAYLAENEGNIVSTVVDLARLLLRSRRHISVAELLVDNAISYEPNDRDVIQLKEHITSDKVLAVTQGVQFVPLHGTAEKYASNAYRLLEE
jgi:tetratricopeptide (TPR) repeat protein/energy-coupling factor transporter ATP-binding protein EcfA2